MGAPGEAVADALAGGDIEDARQSRLDAENGSHAGVGGVVGKRAVEPEPRAHGVVAELGVADGRGRVRDVTHGHGPDEPDRLLDDGGLLDGEGIVLVVGVGEVGPDGLERHAFEAAHAVGERDDLGGGQTETVHAAVDLDVDGHGRLAGTEGRSGDGLGVRFGVDRESDVVRDRRLGVFGEGVAEHEHGSCDPCLAQDERLRQKDDGEALDARRFERGSDNAGAVSVGVRLDHGHDGGVARGLAEDARVVREGVEVEFDPGVERLRGAGEGRIAGCLTVCRHADPFPGRRFDPPTRTGLASVGWTPDATSPAPAR